MPQSSTAATTTQEPRKQAPMEMESMQDGVVVSQPTTEPQPRMEESEPQMSLRGGGFHCGFSCCDGTCRCNRECC